MTDILDTSRMDQVHTKDSMWRYVDHQRGLLTTGFKRREALDATATGFLGTRDALALMKARYLRTYKVSP